MTIENAQATAERINKDGLLSVTELAHGGGYIARFKTDRGLRCMGQKLINHGDGSFGILILGDGAIPRESEAQIILHPHLAGRQKLVATVQLTYDCPHDAESSVQCDMIHNDVSRLLDEDSTTGVACIAVSVGTLAPEAGA